MRGYTGQVTAFLRSQTPRRIVQYATAHALALPKERYKPSFTIGKLKGTRTIMLWQAINDLEARYGSKKRGRTIRIDLPPEDISAIADAY